MKYKTFESLLNTCKNLYDTAAEKDKQIQEAFGGDTQIMTDWWDNSIVEILKSISLEFGRDPENDDTLDWLFWDSMCGYEMNYGYLSYEVDGINYVGSPKNVYLDLTGMLDEKLGDIVHKDTCADELDIVEKYEEYKEEKLETHFMQTKEIDENGDTVLTDVITDMIQHAENLLEKETSKETEQICETFEDKLNNNTEKILYIKNKQIELESKELAKKLDEIDLNLTFEEVKSATDKMFTLLKINADNKDIFNKLKNQLNMVLIGLTNDGMDRSEMEMAEFEAKNVLNRMKEYKEISEYNVEIVGATLKIDFKYKTEDLKYLTVLFRNEKIQIEER